MDKLCGVTIIKNAIKYDYCIKEAIESMLGVCDYVVCAYVESEDDTLEILKSIDADKLKIIYLTEDDWNFHGNEERLNYITNIAIQEADRLGFQYFIYIQGDEILHEKSYAAIREAIQTNEESYMCTRINLWKSPYMQLDVPQERKPCSTQVLRLGKMSCRSYGDAESLMAHTCTFDFTNRIRIYHMGFVRKQDVMRGKIINMQVDVFGMEHYDSKLDESELFNPDLWFDPKTDLKPIDEPLPEIIKNWAKERVYE